MVQCGWDDVPHLDQATKNDLLAGTLPHLREARSKGIPSLGAGAIYPVPFEDIRCDPFPIPAFWPRAFAGDVGWNKTAALWGALDPSSAIIYIYAEHYRGHAEPSVHATAIKGRGEWIPGVMDNGTSQVDGQQLLNIYRGLGLDVIFPNKAVDAGLLMVWELLSQQRLKVFSTCQNFAAEYRLYRRDENGNIIKKFDHLMDCLRYLIMSGMKRATVEPLKNLHNRGNVGDKRAGY